MPASGCGKARRSVGIAGVLIAMPANPSHSQDVINQRTDEDGEQNAGQAAGNFPPCDQRVQHETQRQQPDDRGLKHLDERQETDEHQRYPARDPSNPACGIKRRALLPANASSSFAAPMVAVAAIPRYQVSSPAAIGRESGATKFCKGGAQHQKRHADGRWGIEAERHRGDIAGARYGAPSVRPAMCK